MSLQAAIEQLQSTVEYEAVAFDADEEVDGPDLVEWYATQRQCPGDVINFLVEKERDLRELKVTISKLYREGVSL